MKTARHQRLGAFGMTAVLSVFGGAGLLAKCAPAPVPAAAPAPAPAPAPGSTTAVNVAADILASVNNYRAQNGVPPVGLNPHIISAALDHSTDMAQRLLMTHTGWDGSTAGQRLTANGYGWSTWGENVAAGQTSVSAVMQAWMNSSGHRANILSSAFNEIGAAAVRGSNGVLYWTLDFATGR